MCLEKVGSREISQRLSNQPGESGLDWGCSSGGGEGQHTPANTLNSELTRILGVTGV